MKRILILSLVALSAVVSGCTNWLDVKDETKKLEKDVYQSEEGIDGALNGLYRELMGNNLYGGNLNGNLVDLMAHYYDFPIDGSDRTTSSLNLLGTYAYLNTDVRGQFDAVWNNAYTFILHINTFIKNMEEIEGQNVLSENNRKLFLGEAYGLRAMMHLDIYRLYGPVEPVGEVGVLPYHTRDLIEMPDYSSPKDFLNLVLKDLDKADELMINTDPIKVDLKVYDGANDDSNLDSQQRFAKMYRNKRMNYWAVQALKMRAHMLLGSADDYEVVKTLGVDLLSKTVGAAFSWTSDTDYRGNSMRYSEIIMGASKVDAASWWRTYFEHSSASASSRLINSQVLLQDLWDVTSIEEPKDTRLLQFSQSAVQPGEVNGWVGNEPYLVSTKYQDPSRYQQSLKGSLSYNLRQLRGLIKLSEVEYMIAEALLKLGDGNSDQAIPHVNAVLVNRGYTELEDSAPETWYSTTQLRVGKSTADDVWSMLKMEWYREFVQEGQAWFFYKRNQFIPIAGNNHGETPNWQASNFVWVRPEAETDFDKN